MKATAPSTFAIPWVFTTLVTAFLVTLAASDLYNTQMLPFVYVSATVLVLYSILQWSWRGLVLPSESLVFFTFFAWTALTGWLVASNRGMLFYGVRVLAENACLFLMISSYCAGRRSPAATMAPAIIVAFVQVGYGSISGNYAASAGYSALGAHKTAVQATSLSTNANSLGIQFLWGIAGITFFWYQARGWLRKGILAAAIIALLVCLLYTASRKSLLSVLVFFPLWGWFCYRKAVTGKLRPALSTALLGILGCMAFSYILQSTYMGERITNVSEELAEHGSAGRRMDLYRIAIGAVQSNPLMGLGINQFQFANIHRVYAHCDYLEVLASSGLVGGALYFAIFAMAGRRLLRLERHAPDPGVRYAAAHGLAVLITFLLLGITCVMYNDFMTWCFLAGIVGFAYQADLALSRHFQISEGSMPKAGTAADTHRIIGC